MRLLTLWLPLALLVLDIDHFKAINDGHGHAAGDAVLQQFAQRLCAAVRETDLVARLGGDEFTILVENAVPGTAETIAGKIIEAYDKIWLPKAPILADLRRAGIVMSQRGQSGGLLGTDEDAVQVHGASCVWSLSSAWRSPPSPGRSRP